MTNYISQAEAEELCETMLRLYLGRNTPASDRIDIDGFVRGYLKCRLLYETFAEDDPEKIGFAGDGKTPLQTKKTEKQYRQCSLFRLSCWNASCSPRKNPRIAALPWRMRPVMSSLCV